MQQGSLASEIPQYSLGKILLVWAAAAIPMGILGWIVAPGLARDPHSTGIVRLAVLTLGLMWQCVLVLILVRGEAGNLRWSTLRERLWLIKPSAPPSGERHTRLWWWLLPLLLVTVIFELQISGVIARLWVTVFPFFAEPPGFSMSGLLDSPAGKAQLVGNWAFYGLYLISALFNTFVGEELLFRGLLLPRMAGVFGKADWAVNGLLFGLYHLHQPWGMLDSALEGMFLLALPSRRLRSAWFGIAAHSLQSVFFAVIILGLVLGLA
jgi:hypothetical protein